MTIVGTMTKSFLAVTLLFACAKKNERKVAAEDLDVSALLEKRDVYLSLQREALDSHGYAHAKCDSLGFTALCKAAGGCVDADLFASEDSGRWYRSPEKDCFDLGQSKSDFSKDMTLMLFVYFWETREQDSTKAAISRFRDYVKSTNYVLGRPTDTAEGLSRVLMSPSLISLLEKLHGSGLSELPAPSDSALVTGFEAHLEVLSIWLSGELSGGRINSIDKSTLRKQVERQPGNAIFQAVHHLYTNADMSEVASILSDERLFPSGRLPSSADRCEEYLFQRDNLPKDWEPCPEENEIHDAVDFLVAGHLAGFW